MKALLSIIFSAVGVLIVTVAVQAQAPTPASVPFIYDASGQTALSCTDASRQGCRFSALLGRSVVRRPQLTKSFRRCERPDSMGRANFASQI